MLCSPADYDASLEAFSNPLMVAELDFLSKYDAAKRAIREIVDMPDRKLDLFIRFCAQNRGRLSDRKRTGHFDFLSDDEIEQMEEAVGVAFAGRWL